MISIQEKMAVGKVLLVGLLVFMCTSASLHDYDEPKDGPLAFWYNAGTDNKVVPIFDDENKCYRISTAISQYKIIVVNVTEPHFCNDTFKYGLEALQQLQISSLGLKSLELDVFANLKQLRELDLSNNSLERIPIGIFNNLNLETLDLSHNKLMSIAIGAFDDMQRLHTINLSFNNIERLRKHWFKNCSMLTILNFSNNKITTVQKKAFKNVRPRDDVFVDLSNNKIDYLEEKTFINFEDRGKVDLSNNILSEIPTTIFGYTTVGKFQLILNENDFSCFDKQIFNKVFMNCRSLELYKNPISCECSKRIEHFNRKRGSDLIKYDYSC